MLAAPPPARPCYARPTDGGARTLHDASVRHMPPRRRRKRAQGSIHELPSGALRVSVYSGIDPLTGRRLYLREIVPSGPEAATRPSGLCAASSRRSTRSGIPARARALTSCWIGYLETLAVGEGTRTMYAKYLEKADQRASKSLAERAPTRPVEPASAAERVLGRPKTPRELLAVELRQQILDGVYSDGGLLPECKFRATRRSWRMWSDESPMEGC